MRNCSCIYIYTLWYYLFTCHAHVLLYLACWIPIGVGVFFHATFVSRIRTWMRPFQRCNHRCLARIHLINCILKVYAKRLPQTLARCLEINQVKLQLLWGPVTSSGSTTQWLRRRAGQSKATFKKKKNTTTWVESNWPKKVEVWKKHGSCHC